MDTLVVIVVSYNSLPYNQIFYSSYRRFTHNPNVKLVWVDNASIDGTVEWLHSLDLEDTIFLDKNLGACKARNVAVQETDSDAVCFIDNDMRITQVGWTNRLLRVLLSKPECGAVAPACNLIHDDSRTRAFTENIPEHYSRLSLYADKSGPVFDCEEDVQPYINYYLQRLKNKHFRGSLVLEGGGTTMRRDTFIDIKYPNDFRIAHEGAYLGKGLQDRGLEMWIVPSVFIFHYGHATRNYREIPDLDDKIRRSTIERDKWRGLI